MFIISARHKKIEITAPPKSELFLTTTYIPSYNLYSVFQVSSKMSTCVISQNQPIYQALLDKATTYPADKPYQAKAYRTAAESVLSYDKNLYEAYTGQLPCPSIYGIGNKIEEFICEFVKNNPASAPAPAPAPTPVQKVIEEPSRVILTPGLSRTITCGGTRIYCGHPECPDNTVEPVTIPTQSISPPIATLRCSSRHIGKPAPKYFDEEDEIAEAIESFCVKKHLFYDDKLVTEFKDWLPTADKYALERYDCRANKFIPYPKIEVVIYWAHNFSTSLKKQQTEQKLNKALVKYCEKNGFEYNPLMDEKCGAWMADPVNKKLTTYTIYSRYCKCSDCNPTGVQREAKKYTYDHAPGYCVWKWFATLKKQIIW